MKVMTLPLIFVGLFSLGSSTEPETLRDLEQQIEALILEGKRQGLAIEVLSDTVENNVEDKDVNKKVSKANDGVTFGNSISPSINSFATIFTLFAESSGGLFDAEEANEGTAINVRFNTPGRLLGGKFGVIGTITDPQLFQTLIDSIPESVRATTQSELEDELEDFDDLTLNVAWNLENRNWGRSFTTHTRNKLSEILKRSELLTNSALGKAVSTPSFRCEDLRAFIKPGSEQDFQSACGFGGDMMDLKLSSLTEDGISFVRKRLGNSRRVIQREIDKAKKIRRLLIEKDDLEKLVSNQNQFNITYTWRDKDRILGRDEQTVKVNLELGIKNNLSYLLKRKASFDTLLETVERAHRGSRITFAAEYTNQDDWSNQFLIDSFDGDDPTSLPMLTEFKSSERYKASLTYGVNVLTGNDMKDAKGRWELSLSYEDPDDDTMEQHRFISELRYTSKPADTASVPIIFRYASRGEFLGEVDHEFSARFGVKYKPN